MVIQTVKKCKFYSEKNIAKLNFFNRKIWHIVDYKKMLIYQVFYDFNDIVFEVEVSRR